MTRRQVPVLAALGALAIGAVLVGAFILGSPQARPTPAAPGSPTHSSAALATSTAVVPTPIPTSNPLAGALDPTFLAGLGTPGRTFVETHMPANAFETKASLALDPTGRIYLEIDGSYASSGMNADVWLRIVRYTSAGPDPTFAVFHADAMDDTGSTLIGPLILADRLAIEFDNFAGGASFALLSPSGARAGIIGVPNPVRGAIGYTGDAIARGGQSLLACVDNDPILGTKASIVELTPPGGPGASLATTTFGSLDLWTCRTLVARSDGGVLAAGATTSLQHDNSPIGIEARSSSGGPDTIFAGGGVAPIHTTHAQVISHGLVPSGDGSVVVGLDVIGSDGTPVQAVLERLTGAGQADPTFGNAGVLELTPAGAACRLSAIAAQSDGRVLAATSCVSGATTTSELVRLLADGRGDPTFGKDGHLQVGEPTGAMLVEPSGKLLGVSILDDGRISLWRRLL